MVMRQSERNGTVARWAVVLLAVLLMLVGKAVSAQEAAGITGQVTDESGAVLPGVTVTATSPALQVPSVVGVTDEHGGYRLSPLSIGTYVVQYELSGFQTVRREGVRLTVGFTARIDASLKVGGVAETITVSAAAPVVDVKSTTATTQFTRETLEALPTSRNGIVSVLAQAPGVRGLRDVGGSSLNQVPTAHVFGQGAEVYYTLEGVQTSSLQGSGGQANYWDYTAIEEAQVRTIGNSADMPYRGVNLNAIVKTGGNDFHGSVWYSQTSADLQGKNIDDKLAAQGIRAGGRLVARDSYSGELGGRILRDKLWFYTAGRHMLDNQESLNAFQPDGSLAALGDTAWAQTDKVSYQMTQANRFVGFYQHYKKNQMSFLSQFRPWEYRGGINTYVDTSKVEWQNVHGSSLVTSLQYGLYTYVAHYWNVSRDVPMSFDQVTLQEAGPQNTSGQRPSAPRHHLKGTSTWFRPDLIKGSHEFKFGFDYTNSWFGRQYPDLPADTKEGNGAYSSVQYNYRLIFANGRPFQMEVYNNPALSKVIVHYLGLYAQDSWAINRRLTLNLGLRYAHDNGYVPGGCRDAATPPGQIAFPAGCWDTRQFNVWNPLSPRLHAAWDVLGNGKTMIKGGWGRFDHARQQDPELSVSDPLVRTTVTYSWRDLNGNRDYDPGEVNLNPNLGTAQGGDFVSQVGGSNTVANPNEREPRSDEFSLTLERELMANFALRVSGIYSRYHDTYRLENVRRPYGTYSVPITNQDPGPDGILGTSDDTGRSVTYWEYPSSLSGRQFEQFQLTNDPNADQKYRSIDISLFKRMSRRWQLLASYSATRKDFPIMTTSAVTDANQNVQSGDLNPNAEINTSDRNWEWTAKFSGVYLLPAQISVSAQLEHESGVVFARQVLFRGGRTIPSISLNVEPVGARRLPNTNQLDVRVEKSFALPKSHKVAVRANIFNLLNANTVLSSVRLSGTNFLLPTDIMPPRIAEFSVSYTF